MANQKPSFNNKNKSTINPVLHEGQTIPLTIKRLGINGEGVGFFKKTVVFVPGALPGEEITAEITKVFPNRAEAKVKKLRKPSKDRVTPPCPIYEECGGCQLQHLSYPAQLREKQDIVRQAFERYTKIPASRLPLKDTLGMAHPWDYRNKSSFQAGRKDGRIIAGLYSSNSHELIDIDDCLVQHPDTTKVTNEVKRILKDLNIPIHPDKAKRAAVRTIVVRTSFETEGLQLTLVTSGENLPKKDLFLSEMKKRLPMVTSIVQNVNDKKTSLIFGEKTIHLGGSETIAEKLGDLSFELSARAFFQLNPKQTVVLYDEVKKQAKLTGSEKIVDAYCGSGTIGLWLAPFAKEVRGMDVIEESIANARENAAKHGFKHTVYETGKAEKWLPKWLKEGWKPDVVVVDPPRTGCDESFLQTVLKIKPKRMVYVSCNPSTLAKDVHMLMSGGFEVEEITPVDMFPQTAHIETVCTLIWKG
ncbi:23S rRNA (uracil(1939)-C(5))-methyltransferase RlmD [Fictibacillus aquaticus]|uniref:23S rRNA (Uracil(1939)-C(5))-methyltransferase RlmD n=1 Tax=Fictibacillus aquaticus TaxID=2021314 RepID=A0A235F5A7_9BACL|nr:23S rRNA (uracil(1939)-C(5))-methyltransferase RlmD [Fictibacillus aquaticus]OYD56461.1 23S rRNA (uracil(1939)-C(5))-methyltransferase RlmD [Fictibacillus aquaticus]